MTLYEISNDLGTSVQRLRQDCSLVGPHRFPRDNHQDGGIYEYQHVNRMRIGGSWARGETGVVPYL